MYTVHRIYIAARNTAHHKFFPQDENAVPVILKKYIKAWTVSKALGYYGNVTEETIILTCIQTPQTQTGWMGGIPDAVEELARLLKQYSVLWESNGTAVEVVVGRKKRGRKVPQAATVGTTSPAKVAPPAKTP
ncbi:MAG: hypothetical protein HZA93_08155 [Verrucomicrobia bacterium]|nr:hypothetical protein [Verrucomicrobiota bacterium]